MLVYWWWAIFNLGIGVFELYCYHRRKTGYLTPLPMLQVGGDGRWSAMQLWNEYALADPRYVLPDSQYVWFFELVNAGLALVFFVAMCWSVNVRWLKLILVLQLYGCLFYFMTFLDDDLAQRASDRLVHPFWRHVYFAISSLWIITPLTLILAY